MALPASPGRVQCAGLAGGGIHGVVERGGRGKSLETVRNATPVADPTVCQLCGVVFHRKRWRHARSLQPELLAVATWDLCPACRQEARGQFFGLVTLRGEWVASHRDEVLRRIENVAARAGHTQPERRVLDIRHEEGGIEVRTSSQELAHRIAHELEKAFGGRARYAWSDRDGWLRASWEV